MILNVVAKQQIKAGINEEFGDALVYENMNLNLLTGTLSLGESVLTLENVRIASEDMELAGFSYLNYFSKGKIVIDRFSILEANIIIHEQQPDTSDTSEKFEDNILINTLQLSKGNISLRKAKTEENKLYFLIDKLKIENIGINENSIQQEIPFAYDSYDIKGDSLYLDLDAEHSLSLGKLSAADGEMLLEKLKIIPKYSIEEFDRRIPHERDRFVLLVDSIAMDMLSWSFVNDSLVLNNSLLRLKGAEFEVYRNKLLPDDTSKKTLYSEKIREAPVKLNFERIEVEESSIVYKEQIREGIGPAVVEFTNLNASISGVTNLNMERDDFPLTQIEASANMMGEAPLKVDWEFDVRNIREEFTMSGNLGAVSGEGINSFLKPALNVEASGGIESLAFNFQGNDDTAIGDMRLQYRDFGINVLKKDGAKKSGFLTAIANLFINKDNLNEEAYHENLEVSRDKTKSFWNFFWKFIEAGAIKSIL